MKFGQVRLGQDSSESECNEFGHRNFLGDERKVSKFPALDISVFFAE